MPWLEVVGWAGSAVLVYSLLQTRVVRLRALNLAAAVVLVVYNGALGVWPMVAVNAAIAVINVVHLDRLLRTREDSSAYQVVPVGATEDYLRHVLRTLAVDIDRLNPGFVWDGAVPGSLAYLVLRDTETVGVVLFSRDLAVDRHVAHVELDYVVPRFRTFAVGRFVYRDSGLLHTQGLRQVVASGDRHGDARAHFQRLGFRPRGDALVLDVTAP